MKNKGTELLKKSSTSGITLIALVVTIIVLIILATISINAVFGENGLIKKAEQSKETHIEAQAKEKLSLKLAEYKVEIYEQGIKDATLRDSYLCTKLSELGPTQEIDTQYYEVDVDGWLFWVDRETLEIVSKGKSTPILPEKIEMNESSVEVYIGEGKTIGLTLTPTNTSIRFLKWTSSDETIAKINNGVVTGVKEGTATITVESTEDASIKATCTVTVKPVELTGISLNKAATTISVGETETLEVTYEPENATYKDVTWDSSDKTVATVDNNGVVTALKAGTTKITVTSTKNTSIKAECSVTVEEITEISNADELKTFRDNVNAGNTYENTKVVLTADIDLNPGKYTVSDDGTVTFDSDAEEWEPIGDSTNSFWGKFDGQMHKINGLYMTKSDKTHIGLFGFVKGNIENLVVENVSISGNSNKIIGGIAGYLVGGIKNCGVSGEIKAVGSSSGTTTTIGGVVGYGEKSISNCYNLANIVQDGGQYFIAGGIVACSSGDILNCYNRGNVIAKEAGGISENVYFGAKVENCYNTGKIQATATWTKSTSGIIKDFSGSEISNCYNLGDVAR